MTLHTGAGDAAERDRAMTIQDSCTVDTARQRHAVLTDRISIVISILIRCTRRREFTKLPILTEAQIPGARPLIAKGIRF